MVCNTTLTVQHSDLQYLTLTQMTVGLLYSGFFLADKAFCKNKTRDKISQGDKFVTLNSHTNLLLVIINVCIHDGNLGMLALPEVFQEM